MKKKLIFNPMDFRPNDSNNLPHLYLYNNLKINEANPPREYYQIPRDLIPPHQVSLP